MSGQVNFEPDNNLTWAFCCAESEAESNPSKTLFACIRSLRVNQKVEDDNGYCNPTTYELALASSESYYSFHANPNEKSEQSKLEPGWQWLCSVENKKNRYFGIAFLDIRNVNPRLLIAHRGTTMDWKVLLTDIQGILENQITAQVNSAVAFVLAIREAVVQFREQGIYVQVSITGHSLGGWLAQISAFAIRYLEIHSEITTGKCFRKLEKATGLHAHCVTFDSPGTKQILQRINREIVGDEEFLLKLDITSFVLVPNAINTVNEHVGDLVVLFLEKAAKFWHKAAKLNIGVTIGFGRFLGMSQKVHELTNFVEEIHKEKTVKRRALSWPLVLCQNWSNNTILYKTGLVSAMYKIASTPVRHFLLTNADLLLAEVKDVFVKRESSKYFRTEEYNEQRIHLHLFSENEMNFIIDLFHWNKYNDLSGDEENKDLILIVQTLEGSDLHAREIILPKSLAGDDFISAVRRYVFTYNGKLFTQQKTKPRFRRTV